MLPFICRCCGRQMELASAQNSNLCPACGGIEWEEGVVDEPVSHSSSTELAQEMQYFLNPDGPTVLECYEATEMARQAILETTRQDSGLESSKPTPRPCQVSIQTH